MEEPTCRVLVPFMHPIEAISQVGRPQVTRHMRVILCALGTKGQGLPTSRCSWGMTPPSFFLAASFLPRMSGAYLYHVLMVCEALQCCEFWPPHGVRMGNTYWPSCHHGMESAAVCMPLPCMAEPCSTATKQRLGKIVKISVSGLPVCRGPHL